MLLYILLDTSQSLIYWIIKNLGYATYYSIKYLIYGSDNSEEEEEKRKTLELLIEQKEDIDKIKDFIENMNKEKRNDLPPAALRALAEAGERRKKNEQEKKDMPKEVDGPEGPEPTRYGDWERKGITSDF